MRRSVLSFIVFVALLMLPLAVLAQPLPDQTPRPGTPQPATAPVARPDQQPPPPSTGIAPRAETPAPRYAKILGQPVNVKIEFTINDQIGASSPVQKTVSLLLADRQEGMIRSEGNMPGYGNVQLNVDAEVSLLSPVDRLPDPKILARLGLSYDLVDPKASSTDRQTRSTQIRESLTIVLDNGKSIVLSQSADPLTDRKVTVEVKATIVK
jgi:hypothetical protein